MTISSTLPVIGLVTALIGAGCISQDRGRAVVSDTIGDTTDGGGDGVVCTSTAACDDEDPCTSDSCSVDGRCVNAMIADCESCGLSSDCTARGCFEARCVGQVCTYSAIQPCVACDTSLQCDDGDACTEDTCDADGACAYAAVSCDDGDPCTEHTCDDTAGCKQEDVCEPPVVTVGADAVISEGATWARRGSFDGPPHETFEGLVDYGDATEIQSLPLQTLRLFDLEHIYMDDGAYTVRVTVVDSSDRATTETLVVTVENVAPQITFERPGAIDEGDTLALVGAVVDPGADDLNVTIDWGDGSPVADVALGSDGAFSLTHVYMDDQLYEATIVARDDDNGTTVETFEVAVRNVAPSFTVPETKVIDEGRPVVIAIPITDPGADQLTATVSFGVGEAEQPLEIGDDGVAHLTLRYDDQGAYQVTVTVRDGDDGVTRGLMIVTVKNVAPVIIAPEPVQALEGTPFVQLVSFEDPGADDWLAGALYRDAGGWADVAVDAENRTMTLTHAFPDDGTYWVSFRIDDQDGGVDNGLLEVVVDNVAPDPALGDDETLTEGTLWRRDVTLIDPGADVWSGTASYRAGGAAETLSIDQQTGAYTLQHQYEDDDVYEVSVTIDDNDGGVATDTIRLTVTNVVPKIACGSHAVLEEGDTLVRDCSFTDPGADTWTGTVDYGDGARPVPLVLASDRSFALQHTYNTDGTYTVTVRIADGGDTGQTTFSVAVGNAAPLVDAGLDGTSVEGSVFSQGGTVFDAGADDTFVATVDYGDGGGPQALIIAPDRSFALEHTYAQDGDYTVTVVVADSEQQTGEDEISVSVSNAPPTVEIGKDVVVEEGATVTRDVTATDPGILDVLTATVDYGLGGGPEEVAVGEAGLIQLSQVYAAEGSYTVTLVVNDDANGTVEASFVVDVTNVPPTISLGEPSPAQEGSVWTLDGTFTDPGEDSFTVTVRYGDGTGEVPAEMTGPRSFRLSHTYLQDGEYDVVVTVRDSASAVVAGVTVTVDNVAPTLTMAATATTNEGSLLSRTVVVGDAGVFDSFTGSVDYGDGSRITPVALSAPGDLVVSHRYQQDGVFDLIVSIEDEAGGTRTATMKVTVSNVLPVVNAGSPVTVVEGEPWSRTASFQDPGADTWSATVDYDEGAGPENVVVGGNKNIPLAHTWADDGGYTVVVKVTDDGGSGSDSFAVTVTNAPPVVSAGGPTTIAEGGTLSRSGSVTDPGVLDTLTATVDYGDGGGNAPLPVTQARRFMLEHTYHQSGQFTVSVTVTDDDGDYGEDTFLVTVSNSAPLVDVGDDVQVDEGSLMEKTVSFTDSGDDIWTATADYADGAGPVAVGVEDDKTIDLAKTYPDDGVFDVTVAVYDGAETGEGTFRVNVANVEPVVAIGGDFSVPEGTAWARQGTITDPGTADIHTGTVSYGDGVAHQLVIGTDRGFSIGHTWQDNNVYTVGVTVTDGDDQGTASITATVTNVKPQLPKLSAIALDVGEPLSTRVDFTDPGADTWDVAVDYGDGGPVSYTALTTRQFGLNHTYSVPDSYTLTMTVTDDDGGQDSETVTVNVGNVAPTVDAGDNLEVDEGSPVQVVATFSDPGTDTHTASMTWSATGPTTSATVDETAKSVTGSHTYADDGDYTVTVDVWDSYTDHGADVLTVTVNNVAPIVNIGGNGAADWTGRFQRSGSFSDPGADTWSLTVHWGDGAIEHSLDTSKTLDLDHTYSDSGDYTVKVTVSDGDGGVGQAEFSVAVNVLDCEGVTEAGSKWLGGAAASPTDWHTPENWSPVGVPESTTSAHICRQDANYPVISAAASVVDLFLHDGASIQIEANQKLQANGDVRGGQITGSGKLEMRADGSEIETDVANLDVYADVTVVADMHVSNKLTVNGTHELTLDSVTVTVDNLVTVVVEEIGTDGLRMGDGDTLIVGNKLYYPGVASASASSEGQLAGGDIILYGDFHQGWNSFVGGSQLLFRPTGTRVIFEGSALQHVQFDSPGVRGSHFADVEIASGGLVQHDSDVWIRGQLTIGEEATLTSRYKLDLTQALPIFGAESIYDVDITSISGDIVMTSNLTLSQANNDLVINSGSLTLDGNALFIGGDLRVAPPSPSYAGLVMKNSADYLDVAGDIKFIAAVADVEPEGAPDLDGGISGKRLNDLSAGTVVARSDVRQTDKGEPSYVALRPTGTVFKLMGDADHAIAFDSPSTNIFHKLTLLPGAEVRLESDVVVVDVLKAESTDDGALVTIDGDFQLWVAELELASTWLNQTALVVQGEVTLLQDVTFGDYDPGDVQLTILADEMDVVATGLAFYTAPDAGGAYISGTWSGQGDKAELTVLESLPEHGAPACDTHGGFTLKWGDPNDDTDNDYLPDADEFAAGTDPLDPDTDDDTFIDGTEVALGADPLNTGKRPFWVRETVGYDIGADPWEVVAADVTKNDRLDLIVTTSADNAFTIWHQTEPADGTFEKRMDVALPDSGVPTGVIVADILGNGGAQIIVSDALHNKVRVFGTPHGLWSPISSVNVCSGPSGLVGGNFAWATGPELIVACSGTNKVARVESGPSPSVTEFSTAETGPEWVAAAPGGGGGLDSFASANTKGSTATAWEYFISSYTTTDVSVGPIPDGLAWRDVTNDGRADLIVALRGGGLTVIRKEPVTSGGGFVTELSVPTGGSARSVAVGDIDDNGFVDFATASPTQDAVVLWLVSHISGTTPIAVPHLIAGLPEAGESYVRFVDLNNDGLLDIVTANTLTSQLGVTIQLPAFIGTE